MKFIFRLSVMECDTNKLCMNFAAIVLPSDRTATPYAACNNVVICDVNARVVHL
jgi:hypothetical protein